MNSTGDAEAIHFPFRYSELSPVGRVFHPVVPVGLKINKLGVVYFEFIVDTGADLTTIPYFLARKMGVDFSKCSKGSAEGIGGFQIRTWETTIPVYLRGREFLVYASITRDNKTPPLLGRVDLLDKVFGWDFNAKRKQIIFNPL